MLFTHSLPDQACFVTHTHKHIHRMSLSLESYCFKTSFYPLDFPCISQLNQPFFFTYLPGDLARVVGVQHGGHLGVHLHQSLVQLGPAHFLQLGLPQRSLVFSCFRRLCLILLESRN